MKDNFDKDYYNLDITIRLREGERCQYETLCQTDADCNGPKGQGKCLVVDSAIFPYKECYCADGW